MLGRGDEEVIFTDMFALDDWVVANMFWTLKIPAELDCEALLPMDVFSLPASELVNETPSRKNKDWKILGI